jgi:2-polyprenyl-6-hydroxyphenyl methylase/3-demethylubiquinone-9 3-methyltransferase
MASKNTICLWYDGTAREAAEFYAKTFPDSSVGTIYRAPGDFPSGKQDDVLMVEFTVVGIPCIGLNGGPMFKHSEAFSFQIVTEDQAETDRLWNAIVGNGGAESACGWCRTSGAFRGRSRRASSSTRSAIPIARGPSACSRR